MKNMDLNFGGVVGALASLGVVGAFIFSGDPSEAHRFNKILFGAAFLGGLAGNFLWTQIFGKTAQQELGDGDIDHA